MHIAHFRVETCLAIIINIQNKYMYVVGPLRNAIKTKEKEVKRIFCFVLWADIRTLNTCKLQPKLQQLQICKIERNQTENLHNCCNYIVFLCDRNAHFFSLFFSRRKTKRKKF